MAVPVVLLADVRSVGVQVDGRTTVTGRTSPCSSGDAMTADWSRLPYEIIAESPPGSPMRSMMSIGLSSSDVQTCLAPLSGRNVFMKPDILP